MTFIAAGRAGRARSLAVGLVLTLTAALVLIGAGRASAATWPTSLQSASSFTMPSGTALDVQAAGTLTPGPSIGPVPTLAAATSACDGGGDCVSIVPAASPSNASLSLGVLEVSHDGQPAQAVAVQPPASLSASGAVQFEAVACSTATTCDATGIYTDPTSGQNMSLIVPIIGGVVQPAVPVQESGAEVVLSDIACPASGACVAVGASETSGGTPVPLVVTINGSSIALRPPAMAVGVLTSVSCSASDTCTATGASATPSGDTIGITMPIVSGVPGEPQMVSATLPMYLTSIACPASGACLAAGLTMPASGGGNHHWRSCPSPAAHPARRRCSRPRHRRCSRRELVVGATVPAI